MRFVYALMLTAVIIIFTVMDFPSPVGFSQFHSAMKAVVNPQSVYFIFRPLKFKPFKTYGIHQPAAPVLFAVLIFFIAFFNRIAALAAIIDTEFDRQDIVEFKLEMLLECAFLQCIAAPVLFLVVFELFPPF